jgi:hypothetical protein
MPIDIQLETSAFQRQIEDQWIKGATFEKVGRYDDTCNGKA